MEDGYDSWKMSSRLSFKTYFVLHYLGIIGIISSVGEMRIGYGVLRTLTLNLNLTLVLRLVT